MKEVGLLIDLYQSPTQEESALRHTVSDFFVPLIKIIKSFKNISVSLNIPLSTLELLDKYGYQSIISDIKELYENDRVEIVGSAAYNPLLTKTHFKIIENEIILNEYALGSYFGAKQGFEGEPSMMIKNVDGFLPTGLLVNNTVLDILNELSYTWVLVDDSCLLDTTNGSDGFVYKYGNDLRIVIPNNSIGDLVNSFNTKDFYEIWRSTKLVKDSVGEKIALVISNDLYHIKEDIGPDFYKKKINVIDQLIENLCKDNILVTNVRDLIKSSYPKSILELKGTHELVPSSNTYEDAYLMESDLGKLFKSIDEELENAAPHFLKDMIEDDYSTLLLWKNEEVDTISNNDIHNKVCFSILLYKYICVDKYIYSYMFNVSENTSELLKKSLGRYMKFVRELVKYRSDESFTNTVLPLTESIENIIK
ncbi:MAG: hypothetical protein WAX66_01740 [Patescibacteria group bacterium]